MAEAPNNKLTLRPSIYRRPWHDYKDQRELNAERLSPWHGYAQNAKRSSPEDPDPLLNVVNKKAHTRIAKIRNSRNYQEAHAQNAQSALKVPKLKGVKIGRFSVSSSSVKPLVLLNGNHGRFTLSSEEPSAASASATSVASSSPSIPSLKPNGRYGRFTVSNEEPSVAASSAPSLPSHHKTSRGRAFTISNSPEGGRRTRFRSRRNISRRRRHVGRRRTHRNGA